MSFDPVSYAAGRKAGDGGGEPVLETLSVTENGTYTPETGADGFSDVTVDVPEPIIEPIHSASIFQNGSVTIIPEPGYDVMRAAELSVEVPASEVLEPLYNPAAAGDILSGKEAYDDQGNVLSGSYVPHFQQLSDQASDGDLRYGRDAYDDQGNVISGTIQDIHQRVPIFWDDANSVFLLTSAVLDRAMATLAADGALVGYLLCTGSGAPSLPIPVELVPSAEVEGMVVLTGGVTTGSNDDKYVTQARINPMTGAIDAEKTYYIRAITTLTRHLADWLADGDYLSLFLLA